MFPPKPPPELDIPWVGEDAFLLVPDQICMPYEQFPTWLLEVESPVLLGPLQSKGHVAVWLRSELEGRAAKVFDHNLANQVAILDELRGQVGLTNSTRVLMETDSGLLVLPFPVFDFWASRFGCFVGWNIQTLTGDDRAEARMVLIDGAGRVVPASCRPSWLGEQGRKADSDHEGHS